MQECFRGRSSARRTARGGSTGRPSRPARRPRRTRTWSEAWLARRRRNSPRSRRPPSRPRSCARRTATTPGLGPVPSVRRGVQADGGDRPRGHVVDARRRRRRRRRHRDHRPARQHRLVGVAAFGGRVRPARRDDRPHPPRQGRDGEALRGSARLGRGRPPAAEQEEVHLRHGHHRHPPARPGAPRRRPRRHRADRRGHRRPREAAAVGRGPQARAGRLRHARHPAVPRQR